MEIIYHHRRPDGQLGRIIGKRGGDVSRHGAVEASRSAASAPNPGAASRGASINPVQNRTGLVSASSHDSHAVISGARAAVQLDSSTLLPAPADPTTTVSR